MRLYRMSWSCFCLLDKLCLIPYDPLDYSPSGSSVDGIFQVRILEWVAISFSRGSSWPRDQTQVSHVVGRLTVWATREVLAIGRGVLISSFCCSCTQVGRVRFSLYDVHKALQFTVRQRGRVLWGKPLCRIIVTKAIKSKFKKQFPARSQNCLLWSRVRNGSCETQLGKSADSSMCM